MTEPTIRLETPADHPAIAAVTEAAFGGTDEVRLIERLRADGAVLLSLVAVDEDALVIGHIMFTDLAIETVRRAAALAPMSVHPDCQKHGVGTALLREGLQICRDLGIEVVVVLGHENYYPRFGFSAEMGARLDAPFSGPALMALELTPGTLTGTGLKLTYPPAFGI